MGWVQAHALLTQLLQITSAEIPVVPEIWILSWSIKNLLEIQVINWVIPVTARPYFSLVFEADHLFENLILANFSTLEGGKEADVSAFHLYPRYLEKNRIIYENWKFWNNLLHALLNLEEKQMTERRFDPSPTENEDREGKIWTALKFNVKNLKFNWR